MWLHIVPSFAKRLRALFSPDLRKPDAGSLAGIAQAAERRMLVPAIGRTVPLSDAIASIAELKKTGSLKGKLVITAE